MKKHAFTMIELIFVIVILGVLASVAVPKIAGIQDDALVSSEKAGISAIRGAITSLHGKILLRGNSDFNVTIITTSGIVNKIEIDGANDDAGVASSSNSCAISAEKYPIELSVSDFSNTKNGNAVSSQDANNSSSGYALALVLQSQGRSDYKTVKDSNNTKITGPASNTISTTSDAQINTNNYWLYDSSSGTITFK